MPPEKSIIRRCSSCRGSIRQRTLASGNTFGARHWTDGKMEAPMLSSYPPLVRCPHCSVLLCLPSAEELGTEPPFESEMLGTGDPIEPTEQDWLEALETPLAEAQIGELFIRIEAWHAANNPGRANRNAGAPLPSEAQANMEEISRLLDTEDPKQRIMKAELARELGRFDEVKYLLDFPFAEHHLVLVRLISNLTLQGYRSVAEVSYA